MHTGRELTFTFVSRCICANIHLSIRCLLVLYRVYWFKCNNMGTENEPRPLYTEIVADQTDYFADAHENVAYGYDVVMTS